jgi:hypothetical protein
MRTALGEIVVEGIKTNAPLLSAILDEDWFAGIITIAPRAPTLRPGVTFRGHRIEQVDQHGRGARRRAGMSGERIQLGVQLTAARHGPRGLEQGDLPGSLFHQRR